MYKIKLTSLIPADNIATNDLFEVVDVSDPTMSSITGTNKRVTAQILANGLSSIITGGANITADTSGNAVRIKQSGTGNILALENNTTTQFVINSNGNVGIGTATPTEKLYVNGAIYLGGATTSQGTVASTTDLQQEINVSNRTNTYAVFGPAGASSDWAYLRQIGGFNSQVITLDMHDDLLNASGSSFAIRKIGSYGNNPDVVNTSLYIDGLNNIGIGTATPVCPLDISSAGIQINTNRVISSNSNSSGIVLAGGAGANGANIELYGSSHSGSANAAYIDANVTYFRSADSTSNFVTINSSTASPTPYRLQLSVDSAAKPSTSTWTVASDERLKENIEEADLDQCYDAIKSLPLKRYRWKDQIYSTEQVPDRNKIGWIAQDVQAVFPKAVSEHKFVYNQIKDADGTIISEDSIDDCLSFNSDQIYASLYGTVKKLITIVETLQDRLDELENK
jgi:hypothetical protein